MELTLSTAYGSNTRFSALPSSNSVEFSKFPRIPSYLHRLHYQGWMGYNHQSVSVFHSIKLSAAGQYGDFSSVSTFLNKMAGDLHGVCNVRPNGFQWGIAKNFFLRRLLLLGKKSLKWSTLVVFAMSFASDIYSSVAKGRELTIPLGLFIGVLLAEFLKEFSLEFFLRSSNDREYILHLLGIGLGFAIVRLISLYLNFTGSALLSHISNGALMQVIWLANRFQQCSNEVEDECVN